MGAHLPLRDYAVYVCMKIFDRLFDRNNMTAPLRVDLVDNAGKRGRLTTPRRPGYQDQSLLLIRQLLNHLWQSQFTYRLNLVWDLPYRQTRDTALKKYVGPEPAQALDAEASFSTLYVTWSVFSGVSGA